MGEHRAWQINDTLYASVSNLSSHLSWVYIIFDSGSLRDGEVSQSHL